MAALTTSKLTSSSVLTLFHENSVEVFLETSKILVKIADNILRDPSNVKFRKLRVGNVTVQKKLLPVVGGMECIFQMGFNEDGDYLTLPDDESLLSVIKNVRDDLVEMQARTRNPNVPSVNPMQRTSSNNTPENMQRLQHQFSFLGKLQTSAQHVHIYEDPALQEKAKSCMPTKEFIEKAQSVLANSSSNIATELHSLQDLILLELMSWFKQKFFSWTDQPNCFHCGTKTYNIGSTRPTDNEQLWNASTVEQYQCQVCSRITRFPRYNHPGKLLETRTGRCGEWANCFALCCRALGFEVRYVLDWTDHVWVEVYSQSQKRWLHCDPCENACDKPLLYEKGWGKKLTYVIAFAVDDIQDVTWKYSANHRDVLKRRNECSETWLVQTIINMRYKCQGHLEEGRKKILQERLICELVELFQEHDSNQDNLGGRISGSLAWRHSRGETGESSGSGKAIILTEDEIVSKTLHLQYNCASDQYTRVSSGSQTIKSWTSMATKIDKIVRKEENDWKMVYLARQPGSEASTITWEFDFRGSGLSIETVELQALSTRFGTGQVLWALKAGDQTAFLPPSGNRTTFQNLRGSTRLSLTAGLRGGDGDIAWQQSQIFRQPSDELFTAPLEIKIFLKDQSAI